MQVQNYGLHRQNNNIMKRVNTLTKRTVLVVLLVAFAFVGYAQTNKFNTIIGTDLGFGSEGYKIVTPHLSVTYDLTPKLSAGVKVEDAVTLMKNQDVKRYDMLLTLGGQVGYDVCKVLFILNMQPRIMVGHTIGGGHDRGYMYYQGGLYFKRDEGGVRFETGLGYRYNDYRSDLNKDKGVFFVSYAIFLK
jgi:hypothetical protein